MSDIKNWNFNELEYKRYEVGNTEQLSEFLFATRQFPATNISYSNTSMTHSGQSRRN